MKKKGFTLIELLAVIVILAIIALIATPLVLNTIDKAKQGAAEASALEYMNAVERYMVEAMLDTTMPQLQPGVEYQLSSTKYEVAAVADPNTVYINDLINIKGDKPEKGYLIVNNQGTVQEMEMIMNGYPIVCANARCEVVGGKYETYNAGDIVSLNIGNDTSSEWYVMEDSSEIKDTVKLFKITNIDNNTYAYDELGNRTAENSTLCATLLEEGFFNELYNNQCSLTIYGSYEGEHTFESEGDSYTGTVTVDSSIKRQVDTYANGLGLGNNLKEIRLLTAQEYRHLSNDNKNITWLTSSSYWLNNNDRVYIDGSAIRTGNSDIVGSLLTNNSEFGIRPVITVSKAALD